MAAVPGTAYVLVCNAGSDAVSVIDTRTARETQRIAVGREPRHVVTAEDGLSAYVSEQGAGTVCRLDLTALHENGSGAVELVWRSMLGRHVQPCLVVPTGGGTAVVLTRRGPRLPLLDLTSGLMLASVALPAAAAVSAGGAVGAVSVGEGFLLVAVERPGLIAVVDLLECTVSRTITLGARPRDITIDPADQTVYCALPWSGRVAVVHLDGVDLSTEDGRPQFESIAAGRAPCSVAVLADSDFDET
nr:hypothetical protein [Streptomyces sp. SID8367]